MKYHAADKIGASVLSAALIMALAPTTTLASDPAGGGAPPSMPSASSTQSPGDAPKPPDGQPGGAPSGGSNQSGEGQPGGAPGGADTQAFDYTGAYSGALVADGAEKASSGAKTSAAIADQNVALAQNGGTLSIDKGTLSKSGDESDGDKANFYGVNSSVLAVGSGSLVKIANSSVRSTSEGSNGLFATDGGAVYANNDAITTEKGGNARGLDATYGGVIVGNRLTVSTRGEHCAATATDRGGGYVSVSNSKLRTAGSGSPLVYSTGDIELDHVTGMATSSQVAGMEGVNKILISNSDLASTNDAISGSDPIKNAVILYQSTSGDAEVSSSDVADFEAGESTLSSSITDGAFFYVTNTTANIVLKENALNFDSNRVELLHAAGNNANNWGTNGSNAGNTALTGIGQNLSGNVYADQISAATLYLTDGSTWNGAVAAENRTGDGTTAAPGNVTVNVDATSTWTVSGDTTVGNLNVAQGGKVTDTSGKSATIKDGAGNTLQAGDSTITVTVSSTYTANATISGAGATSGASETLASARATFDAAYGTSTAWARNGSSELGAQISASTGTTSDDRAKSIVITAKTVSAKSLKAAARKNGPKASVKSA